jgi:hypothetical protein
LASGKTEKRCAFSSVRFFAKAGPESASKFKLLPFIKTQASYRELLRYQSNFPAQVCQPVPKALGCPLVKEIEYLITPGGFFSSSSSFAFRS